MKRSEMMRRIEEGDSYSSFAITSLAMAVILGVVVLLNIWVSLG